MANNTTNNTFIAQHDSDSGLQDQDLVVLLTSCVIGVIANIFVTYLILTVRRLKTVTNVFVFSTCLCNVMVSSVLLPMEVLMNDSHDWVFHLAYKFINLITILIYICNLTAVSYDRLLSITQPMVYTLKQTRRKAIIIVFFMWAIPLFYGLLPLLWVFDYLQNMMVPGNMYQIIHKVYLTSTLVVFLLGPLFYIIYVYMRVLVEMKRMNAFKIKLMTPIHNNIFKRKKRPTNNLSILRNLPNKILHHMTDASKTNDDKKSNVDDESSRAEHCALNSKSICTYSWDLAPDESTSHKPVSRTLTQTSDLSDEKLEELLEHQDDSNSGESPCILNSPYSRCVPKTTMINQNSYKKASVVTFDSRPSSFATKNGSNTTINTTRARKTPLDDTQLLSPTFIKRHSSLARMKHKAQELKSSFAFLIVAITYMFTWLPVVALTFDDVLERYRLPHSLVKMSLYAIAINALTDPFLYGLLLPNFRKTLKIMLGRLKGKW